MKGRATVLTAALAAALVTTGPVQAATAADPSPNPAARQPTQPDARRGPAIGSGSPQTPERIREVLGIPAGAKPLTASRTGRAGTYTVTIDALNRKGLPPVTDDAPYVYFTSLDGAVNEYAELVNGHFAGPLPRGEYIVQTHVSTAEPGGGKSHTVVYLARVVLDQDRSLVLDAREGRPVTIDVDRPDARLVGTEQPSANARIVQNIGGKTTSTMILDFPEDPVYLTPSGPAPGLQLLLSGRLTKNGASAGSPYIYNVAGPVAEQGIPADPALRVRTSDLATVQALYARQGKPGCAGSGAQPLLPGGGLGTGWSVVVGPVPATPTEYFSPGIDWFTQTGIGPVDCLFNEGHDVTAQENYPRAGNYTRSRTSGPFGPGPNRSTAFSDGRLDIFVPLLSPWDGDYSDSSALTGQTSLESADGTVIGKSSEPGRGAFTLPGKRAAYKLTTDVHRGTTPWSDLATRQHVVWTFTAQRPSEEWVRLPLLSVGHHVALDNNNRARVGTQVVELSARPDEGVPTPRTISRLTLQASYDEGVTWVNAPVQQTSNGWRATVSNPQGAAGKFVSLRTVAKDTAGRTVDQTVIRAYGLAP